MLPYQPPWFSRTLFGWFPRQIRSCDVLNPMRRRMLIFLLSAAAALVSQTLIAADNAKPLKVFVFAGQSNMAGVRSVATDLQHPELARAHENLAFKDGEWLPLAPGNTQNVLASGGPNGNKRAERAAQGFGPEISFAHRVAAALGEPVGVVKFAVGNTSLQLHWLPDGKGKLYEHLRRLVREAGEKRPIEVVGMLWMQGERDAGDAGQGAAYADNLRKLVEGARRDFGNPEMIFVAGRINLPKAKNPAALEAVRTALAGATLDHYGWIDCDDLPTVSDRLHFDTRGIGTMGERMAETFLHIKNESTKPSP